MGSANVCAILLDDKSDNVCVALQHCQVKGCAAIGVRCAEIRPKLAGQQAHRRDVTLLGGGVQRGAAIGGRRVLVGPQVPYEYADRFEVAVVCGEVYGVG